MEVVTDGQSLVDTRHALKKTFRGSPEASVGAWKKILVTTVVVAILSVISYRFFRDKLVVPKMLLPSLSRQNADRFATIRSAYQQQYSGQIEFVRIPVRDRRVQLSGMLYWHNEEDTRGDNKQSDPNQKPVSKWARRKWLVWFNPNASCFEDRIEFLVKYARGLGVHLLAFNYRGIETGRVRGPKKDSELILDGEDVLGWLIGKGVPSDHILVHGHSMGGGVGTMARVRYPGPLINDRSFSCLQNVSQAMMEDQGIGRLSSRLLYWMRWRLDAVSAWQRIPGKKGIIYHKQDETVTYANSSLHAQLVKRSISLEDTVTLELKRTSSVDERGNDVPLNCHSHSLDQFEDDWQSLLRMARLLLN